MRIKISKIIMELEYLLINSNKEERAANQECINLNYIIEVETKTATEQGLIIGIITLLDTVFIAL